MQFNGRQSHRCLARPGQRASACPGPARPHLAQHPTLTRDDFKAARQKSISYPSALSDTGFKYQLVCSNGMLDIDVAAFFSPNGSWVKPDGKTPELLRHEQGHFDMAELYALRLRKATPDAKISCDDTPRLMPLARRSWPNSKGTGRMRSAITSKTPSTGPTSGNKMQRPRGSGLASRR